MYSLKTVTYGTASAPYLAIIVLQQLATDQEESDPVASEILCSDTYVEHVISGADSFKDALKLQAIEQRLS